MQLQGKDVLLVEDNLFERKQATAFLEGAGASVSAAANLAEARRLLEALSFDFALLDVNLPDGDGLSLLREGLLPRTIATVVATANDDVSLAVEAMRFGALDFLVKPYPHEELPIVFARSRQAQHTERRTRHERARERDRSDAFFFGRAMETIQRQIETLLRKEAKLAGRFPPILLEGETGTGKTLLARWIHENGSRADKPFVDLNCANLSEQLAASELFGHEKGAFTDARTASVGLFEAADGGTLFLDEIATLSAPVQAQLLKAIEQQSIRRLGSRKDVRVDVRLIGASIEPLEQLVAAGRFREDLFQRLNLVRIALPPLRERREDLPALLDLLLGALCQRYRQPKPTLTARARRQLANYPWPGNVRELEHELERSLIFSEEGELDFASLPPPAAEDDGDPTHSAPSAWLRDDWTFPAEGLPLDEVTRTFIDLAMEKTDGNLSQAARLLHLPRHVLRYMLKGKS
ncbi:MAG: sigma-54-dependent transcriptional regulator [Opitutales bacterium]